jgi:hypothetical protein
MDVNAKAAADEGCRLEKDGRGERIRTSDPLVPNQVLYQAEPLPDGGEGVGGRVVGA